MTDVSAVPTDDLLRAAGLTPNAHPVEQPPPGPDLSGISNADLMKAAGNVSVPILPPEQADNNSPPPTGGDMPTAFPGFQHGLADLYSGGVQLLLHALEATAPAGSSVEKKAKELRQAMDDKIKQDEAAYVAGNPKLQKRQQEASDLSSITGQNVVPLDAGRLAGNIVGSAPLAAIAPESLPGRVAAGAITGGLTAAAQPSTAQGNDYWLEKAKQASTGAIVGTAAAPLAGATARLIKPKASENEAIQSLVSNDVNPTLGQVFGQGGVLGKAVGRAEEGLTSAPLLGDAIKYGQRGAIQDFQRATINQALAPIGEKLGDTTALGRKAIDEMVTKIQDSYEKTLAPLTVGADQQLAQGVTNLRSLAQNLPGDYAKQFDKVLQNEVLDKFAANGTMSGKTFKEVDSTLGQIAADYSNSGTVNERYFGRAVRQLQDEMRQLVSRSNPDEAQALQAANDAYAMAKRIQGASISSVKGGGEFTPAQLLMAVRNQDRTLGKSAFARGDALMQTLGEAGESVLGSKVPDSGTAFRTLIEHPIWTGALSVPALAAVAAHSPLGRKLLSITLAQRPQLAAPVAQGVRNFGPVLGGSLAASEQRPQ